MAIGPFRLENLTGHALTIDTRSAASDPDVHGVGAPASIDPEGSLALVAEDSAGEGTLNTDYGWVRCLGLRRTCGVTGLPSPQPGTAFVVPRLTALAARDRADLYFPHLERRDGTGTVIGARALGQFLPDPHRRRRLRLSAGRAAGAGAGVDRDVVQRATWRLGLAVAVATALIGAALGTLPSAIGGNPHDPGFWPMCIAAGLMLALGAATLVHAWRLWRLRDRVLNRHGTAYVLDQLSAHWTYEEKRSFLNDLTPHFASVLRVPGPADLGQDWDWPLTSGAERWDEQVDVLVHSFWSVQFNDDQVTHNALFVWAWWPVALAFAARASTGRRGLQLRVRHRPSNGRGGAVEGLSWRRDPILFFRDPSLPRCGGEVASRTIRLTITPTGAAAPAAGPQGPVTVLLVRMIGSAFGPLLPDTGATDDLHFPIADAAGTGLSGPYSAQLREWRCLPPTGELHPWSEYHALAQEAATWIGQTSRAVGGTVLLGMLVPQEVAVGIGALAGSTPKDRWPELLWPIQFHEADGTHHPVIPGLNLGYRGLRPGPVR